MKKVAYVYFAHGIKFKIIKQEKIHDLEDWFYDQKLSNIFIYICEGETLFFNKEYVCAIKVKRKRWWLF